MCMCKKSTISHFVSIGVASVKYPVAHTRTEFQLWELIKCMLYNTLVHAFEDFDNSLKQ